MNHLSIAKNKVAVITGAAAGIGFALAKRLAAEGMKVIMTDINREKLEQAHNKIKAQVINAEIKIIVGDIVLKSTHSDLFKTATEWGEVSLLVNNAAVNSKAGPWEQTDNWSRVMNVNFNAALALQQCFVPFMLNQKSPSAVVNLGSKEGITTPPGNTVYSVSKSAIKVLTEQLAFELRQVSNLVSAHLLIPGYTFTPMNYPSMTDTTEKPPAMWSADQVVNRMLEGMAEESFYIFCEDNDVSWSLDQLRMQWAADDMILNRPALSRWHPEHAQSFHEFIKDAGCNK